MWYTNYNNISFYFLLLFLRNSVLTKTIFRKKLEKLENNSRQSVIINFN